MRRLVFIFFCLTAALGAEKLPLLRRIFGSPDLSEKLFLETVAKLNRFESYAFTEAYRSDATHAVFSGRAGSVCWLRFHNDDELADQQARELADYKTPVFRYANWVGFCLAGDAEDLAAKVRLILIGAGAWKD